MMTQLKRFAGIFLALLFLLLLPVQAFAAESVDVNRDVKLTVLYEDKDTGAPIAGAAFSLYNIGSVSSSGEVTLSPAYSDYNDQFGTDTETLTKLAATLEGYVRRENITPDDSGVTDSDGRLEFPTDGTMKPGLYLLTGEVLTQNGKTYLPQPMIITIPVTGPDDGTLYYSVTLRPKYELVKDTTVDRKVLKVWDDKGAESVRPQEVTVHLVRGDGTVVDTVTLNAENGWSYEWKGLDASYSWHITEDPIEDYQVQIYREGITIVVNNTYTGKPLPEPPDEPDLPDAGQLWWPVPILLFFGILMLVISAVRRRGAADEE